MTRLLPGLASIALLVGPTSLRSQNFGGTVTEAGSAKPVRGANIRVKQVGAARLTADLETGSGGRFQAAVDLAPGDYRIEISKPNYANVSMQTRLPLSGPLNLKLVRFGSISGRVVDAQNRPLPGAAVFTMEAVEGGGGQLRPSTRGLAATVDSSGSYRLFNLPPGRYSLAVTWANMGSGSTEPSAHSGAYLYPSNARPEVFSVTSGTALSGIDFTLPPQSEHSVTGRVTGLKAGQQGAVALVLSDQPALAATMQLTKADGAFRFERIAPGAYELRASGPVSGYSMYGAALEGDMMFGRRRLDVAGQHVTGAEVALEPARTAKLLLDLAPECRSALPGTASVSLDSLEVWSAMLYQGLEAAPGRETTVSNLAPGRYRLRIVKPAEGCFGAGAVIADFGSAKAGPVRLAIVPGGTVEGRAESADMVWLTDLDDPQQPARMATPDRERWAYRFTELRPGRYRVEAGAVRREVTVRPGGVTEAHLPREEKQP